MSNGVPPGKVDENMGCRWIAVEQEIAPEQPPAPCQPVSRAESVLPAAHQNIKRQSAQEDNQCVIGDGAVEKAELRQTSHHSVAVSASNPLPGHRQRAVAKIQMSVPAPTMVENNWMTWAPIPIPAKALVLLPCASRQKTVCPAHGKADYSWCIRQVEQSDICVPEMRPAGRSRHQSGHGLSAKPH